MSLFIRATAVNQNESAEDHFDNFFSTQKWALPGVGMVGEEHPPGPLIPFLFIGMDVSAHPLLEIVQCFLGIVLALNRVLFV